VLKVILQSARLLLNVSYKKWWSRMYYLLPRESICFVGGATALPAPPIPTPVDKS